MELLFGSHVRSGSRRIGYLAGVEVEPTARRVTKIIFSDDGKLGSHSHTRAIEAVRTDRSHILIEEAAAAPAVPPGERAVWSRSVRIKRDGRDAGHLAGVVVGAHGAIESAIGRQHWWTGRSRVAAADFDLAQPGEIRVRAAGSRAA